MIKRVGLILGLLGSLLAAPVCAQAPIADGAKVHPPYHGLVPQKSDVVFSTRFKRPEAPALIKAFGSTRVEWVYTTDKAFAAALKETAPWLGGTLNGNGPLDSDEGYVRDFDGAVLSAPWMKGWDGRWVTTTHRVTQERMASQVRNYASLGIDSIQFDDPLLQLYAAIYQAGDFNPSTLQGFPDWLATRADPAKVAAAGLTGFRGDYRAFLKERHKVVDAKDYSRRFRGFPSTALWLGYIQSTVEDHFVRLRRQLSDVLGRPVPISMNLSVLYEPIEANRFFFLAAHADYSMAESHIGKMTEMTSQAATARALGMGFVPSLRPSTVSDNRVAIATLYALGGLPVVPWDVYHGNDDKGQAKRYFGTVEQFGDLFNFVRGNRDLFDGLETAALVGVVVPVDKGRAEVIRDIVGHLVERQVPFAFIPVGGTNRRYEADPARLRHLQILITTNPDADYSAGDLRALKASGVHRVSAASMSNEQWADLQPFLVAPGAERVRLLVRSDPADAKRWVLHVVDAGSAAALGTEDPACSRRLGIRRQVLGTGTIATARWRVGAKSTVLPVTGAKQDVFVTLPSCPVWGVLDVRMQ